jgi:copper chaperone NosL
MKRFFMSLLICMLFAATSAIGAEKVEPPGECKQCGMDRVAFAHGRMLIKYADGTTVGTCSLNCAAAEMKVNKGKKVKAVKVADYGTKKLVNARSAVWVIGGSKDGIMTSVPKWAFAGKAAAERFVKENGGRITGYDEALNLAMGENE